MMQQPCREDSSTAHESTIGRPNARLRQLEAQQRTQQSAGPMPALKKVFYKIIHATLPRQPRSTSIAVESIDAMDQVTTRQEQSLASCGQMQDQAELNNIRPLHGFRHVYTSPAEMRMPERVLLYSLVFGLQPKNCLEIGTFRGGSTAIICGAMDDTGFGRLACVDPAPQIDPRLWSQIHTRCQLFEGPSPDILPQVARQTGAAFDFALIDGNHTYDCLRQDIVGVLPILANRANLLFHDALYPDVQKAIDEALVANRQLTDAGLLSVEPTVLHQNGAQVTFAGLRLLKFQR